MNLRYALPLFLCAALISGCGTADNLDRIPPEVTVIEPESDEIGAPILVSVTAADNVAVSGVSFYIDGVFLERKTSPPYTFMWYSDYWGDGRGHLLSASAVDPSGNVGMSKAVNVEVMKTTRPTVEVTAPPHHGVVTQPLVNLRWKPIANTKLYSVQISDTSSVDYLIVDTTTPDTILTVELPDEGTYRWRVRPSAIGNVIGGWTKEHLFHRTDDFTAIFGRRRYDAVAAIAATADNGLILAGSTHTPEKGGMLMAMDANGNLRWERFFAGMDLCWFSAVVQMPDGGFMAGGQNSPKSSSSDRWFVRTDTNGMMVWNRTLLTDGAQRVSSIMTTLDSGVVVCSTTDGDSNGVDVLLTKYDAAFDVVWERSVSGRFHDEGMHLSPTRDGGFLLSGFSQKGTDRASDRAMLVRFNFLGEERWRRDLRSNGGARFAAVVEHRGRFYVCGTSRTRDNQQDALVAAFDSSGSHLWTKTFGGLRDDAATGIAALRGRIAVCGSTAADSLGEQDAWLLILDPEGAVIADRKFGGKYHDAATGITATADGFAVAGTTSSFSAGSSDGFLIITDPDGNVRHRSP